MKDEYDFIQPTHAPRLRLQLATLNAASGPEDMNRPGWKFHALKGDLADVFTGLAENSDPQVVNIANETVSTEPWNYGISCIP